jgi:hypothetical protein
MSAKFCTIVALVLVATAAAAGTRAGIRTRVITAEQEKELDSVLTFAKIKAIHMGHMVRHARWKSVLIPLAAGRCGQ